MKSVLKLPAATLLPGILAAALSVAPARADVVTDWNVTANAVMTDENVGNNPRLRTLAMVHVAMSDAINSVQARYARVIATTIPAVPSASPEAAASAAARHILNQLYPKQKAEDRCRTRGSAEGHSRGAGFDPRHCAWRAGGRCRPGRPRGRRHQRPRHLPAAREPGRLRDDRTAAVRAICARKTMGHREGRPVPARPAAAIVERGLRQGLQRGESSRRHQEHRAYP